MWTAKILFKWTVSLFSLPRFLLVELRQCQQEVSGGFLSRLEWPCLAWLIKKRLGGLD